MVNLVHLDSGWACILDNNFIGPNDLVWMTPQEFADRWMGKGSGWAVVFLRQPPYPPVSAEYSMRRAECEKSDIDGWTYYWYYFQADPGRLYLYCANNSWNDNPVGAYDVKERYFRYFDEQRLTWLKKTEPPFPPPQINPYYQRTGQVGEPFKDYGVPLHLFPPRQPDEEIWTRQGQRAIKADILALMQPMQPSPPPQPPPPPRPGPQPPSPSPNHDGDGPLLVFSIFALLLFAAHLLPKESN
jgi:hypothetical protein